MVGEEALFLGAALSPDRQESNWFEQLTPPKSRPPLLLLRIILLEANLFIRESELQDIHSVLVCEG